MSTIRITHLKYISIGLNVGKAEPEGQYARTIGLLCATFGGAIYSIQTGVSAWQDTQERFMQVAVVGAPKPDAYHDVARALQQDCIATASADSEYWTLHYADGRVICGALVREYPILTPTHQGE